MLIHVVLVLATLFILLLSRCGPVASQCGTPSCSPCTSCGCQQQRDNRTYITNTCDLDCDFDKPCRWRNGTNGMDDDFDWPIDTSVILDHWHSIPRGRDGPCDPFAYTRGAFGTKHADNRAILASDPIHCQVGNGMLKFWYWKTALYPSMRVCIRKPPGPCGVLDCIATIHGLHRQEWIMKTVIIHQQTEPFEIVFEARFKHNFDIIGLDKISYSARLCEPAQPVTVVPTLPPATYAVPDTTLRPNFDTVTTRTIGYTLGPPPITFPQYVPQPTPVPVPPATPYAPPGQRPLTGLNDPDVLGPAPLPGPTPPPAPIPGPAAPVAVPGGGPCPAVDCAFDRGSPCLYGLGGPGASSVQLPPGASLRQWRVTNKETANSLTGIFSDLTGTGMYAFAGETTNNLDMYVLESPRFVVTTPSMIEFSYYLAGIQGRLRGCVNGIADCRFESLGKDIKSDARRWRRGVFQLDPGTYTVNFVGDNLGKNYVIGLDNIELKSPQGALLPCV